MKTKVKEIPFNGSTLLGVKTEDGKVWLAVRKSCRDIGLTDGQADNEVKKVKASLLFANEWRELSVKYDGQVRTTLVLSEKFVPMWLAQIRLTPTMKKESPKAVDTLLTYQLEAADVLHKAFYETDDQKEKFHSNLGLNGKIECMQVQINNMENMMCEQIEKLDSVMENMTLSTRQQQKLYHAAKDRVNFLLGGANSIEYKQNARRYFINLWNGLKAEYGCSSYKDLNPIYYNNALDYINQWEFL